LIKKTTHSDQDQCNGFQDMHSSLND
jgi:hypothetical protein